VFGEAFEVFQSFIGLITRKEVLIFEQSNLESIDFRKSLREKYIIYMALTY